MARAPFWLATLLALIGVSAAGCAEWLEVDEEAPAPVPAGDPEYIVPAYLPDEPARLDGRGPLVPSTPGLSVPDGYFTRVRVDVADMLLPYSWMALMRGERLITVRLLAVGGPTGEGEPPLPVLRAVVPMPVPEGTEIDTLSGLTFGRAALAHATAKIRTTATDSWLLELDRFSIEEVGRTAIKGSFEGRARRGSKAKKWRAFHVGFVALLAPGR